MFSDLFRRLK